MQDAACTRPLIGLLSKDEEDVNTRASVIDILLLISVDFYTAQSVSVCLSSAGVKDSDVGPELLHCQFKKLTDKLAEHLSDTQNVTPNVTHSISLSDATPTWVPGSGNACVVDKKCVTDDTDAHSEAGRGSTSVVSRSVATGKPLHEAAPLSTDEGAQTKRATPSLPDMPSSMLFCAPQPTCQVDAHGLADPSSSVQAAVSPTVSQACSSAAPSTLRQQMQLPATPAAATSSTIPRPSAAAAGLLTKLRSRTAASMLEGQGGSQQKLLNSAVSTQDHQASRHWSASHDKSCLGDLTPVQVACAAVKTHADSSGNVTFRRVEAAGPNGTPPATFSSHMQSSVHLPSPTSGPSKLQQTAPLFQAMLEQSTRDRAKQFAREGSLAAAAVQNANTRVGMGGSNVSADTSNKDEGGIVPRQVQLRAGVLDDAQDAPPRMLPHVKLNAADEEMLFGLTVRLQYAESDLEVAYALQELASCTVVDIPPAAILHRTTLLDNVMNVMTSSHASETTRNLAIQFLHSLVIQSKQALQQANDPEQCPLYDAFDGPSSAGDLHIEEEHLLNSYPQPAAVHKLPRWCDENSTQMVDVDACFHIVGLRVMRMLSYTCLTLCFTLSLLEALLPLLRLDSSHACSSSTLERLKQYMEVLSSSLEAHIVRPAHPGFSVELQNAPNQILLLKHSGIAVSVMLMRFLTCVPVSHAKDIIPPQLQVTLEQLWCNPLMDIVVPSWRACVEPYVSALSPLCARANSVAVHAVRAVDSAGAMQKEAQLVLGGTVPLSVWLQCMPLALMATAFTPHKELIGTIMHTAVGALAKQKETKSVDVSDLQAASGVFQALLQHPVPVVADKAWSVLSQLLHELPRQSAHFIALIELLTNDTCMRFMFGSVLPSGEEDRNECALQLLAAIASADQQSVMHVFSPWRQWLECYLSAPALKHLSQTQQGLTANGDSEGEHCTQWEDICVLLQRLYSKKGRKACQDAASRLRSRVFAHMKTEDSSHGMYAEDPFRGLLDASTAVSLLDQDQNGRLEDLNISDVHNLMSCACNTSLPDAVRTSALQKLSKEVREPVFLAAIAVPSFLQEVLQCVEGCAAELVDSSAATNVAAPAAMHSVQLCAHSLFLLGSLCCRSHGVLTWILGQKARLISLLPLVFHPVTMARRGMAVFLAPVVFLPAIHLMTKDADLSSVHSAAAPQISLLPVFHGLYHMPLPVAELQWEAIPQSASVTVEGGETNEFSVESTRFLSSEKQEVVQLIFFLLSAGRLVEMCRAQCTRGINHGCNSKELQLREMQQCASMLQNLPSDLHLSLEHREQMLSFLHQAAPLARLDIAEWLESGGGTCMTLLPELCQSCSGARLICGMENAMAQCFNAMMRAPTQVSELLEWDVMIAYLGQLLATRAVPDGLLVQLVETAVPATISLLARWSHTTSTAPALGKSDESFQEQESLHLVALPAQQEHRHAQPVIVSALQFLAILLHEGCTRCTVKQLVQILELMSGVDFVGLLLNSVLANTHLTRASQYAAGACMCEILRKMDRVATFVSSVHTEECSTLASSVESCVQSLQPSLCALLQHVVRNIGMPAQHDEQGTFLGRHMLCMGMRMLQLICRVLPSNKWSEAWVSAVGVFWLTKQLKSVDLNVRCQAAQLLCIVAHPAALDMQSTILQAWPEGGTLMMRHGLSRRQPPAFSAAALTFTATSMASSTVDVPTSDNQKAVNGGVTEFGCEAVLSREYLWEGLLARVPACGRSPMLACSICMLLQLHAACAAEDAGDLLRRQGVPCDSLLQHLDIRQQITTSEALDSCLNRNLQHKGFGFTSINPHMRTGLSAGDSVALCHPQPEACKDLELQQQHSCAIQSQMCQNSEQGHHVSRIIQVRRETYGYCLLCDSSATAVVSAIRCAGHVSALVSSMLATVPEQVTVDKVRALELVLGSVALICPVAACAFTPHTSTAGQESSTAAAASAVDLIQCGCLLLKDVRMSHENMQDVLAHVKSYARIELSVALAHVLQSRQSVPQRLWVATTSLLHCMLGSAEYAQPFLHSFQDDAEHQCPAALGDSDAEGVIPVGQALFVGLFPQAKALLNTAVRESVSGPQHKDFADKSMLEIRAVLDSLLSQSTAASAFAVAHDFHESWTANAEAALGGLVVGDRQKSSAGAASNEAAAWLSLLRALAHRDEAAMSAIAQTGVIEAIHMHWSKVCGHAAVLHETVSLLCTLVSESFDARHIISAATQPPLLLTISRLVHQDGYTSMQNAVCQLLCNLATALDGALALLKSQVIPEAFKALQTALSRNDDAAADRILKIFSAITSHSAGQRQLMRLQGLPPFLEIAADLPTQRMPRTWTSLLLLIRNLAFLSDNKVYFLADPRILKLLAHQGAAVAHSPLNAAYAMSALWALLHKGERVKATLKGIPEVAASVHACTSACSKLLQDGRSSGNPESKLETLQQLQQSAQVVSRALGLDVQKTEC